MAFNSRMNSSNSNESLKEKIINRWHTDPVFKKIVQVGTAAAAITVCVLLYTGKTSISLGSKVKEGETKNVALARELIARPKSLEEIKNAEKLVAVYTESAKYNGFLDTINQVKALYVIFDGEYKKASSESISPDSGIAILKKEAKYDADGFEILEHSLKTARGAALKLGSNFGRKDETLAKTLTQKKESSSTIASLEETVAAKDSAARIEAEQNRIYSNLELGEYQMSRFLQFNSNYISIDPNQDGVEDGYIWNIENIPNTKNGKISQVNTRDKTDIEVAKFAKKALEDCGLRDWLKRFGNKNYISQDQTRDITKISFKYEDGIFKVTAYKGDNSKEVKTELRNEEQVKVKSYFNQCNTYVPKVNR
ncbi:MAG: hypothetical protein WC755_00390 [Candidatus Woesearchaeota archaeon]|jgi:hypothetical protein